MAALPAHSSRIRISSCNRYHLLATLTVVFRLYDIDGDGFITRADLVRLLELLVGTSMSGEAIALAADKTLQQADVDGDGRISADDFASVRASG